MTSPSSSSKKTKKPVRIWVDGCFDMMHFGHANALRQVSKAPVKAIMLFFICSSVVVRQRRLEMCWLWVCIQMQKS